WVRDALERVRVVAGRDRGAVRPGPAVADVERVRQPVVRDAPGVGAGGGDLAGGEVEAHEGHELVGGEVVEPVRGGVDDGDVLVEGDVELLRLGQAGQRQREEREPDEPATETVRTADGHVYLHPGPSHDS